MGIELPFKNTPTLSECLDCGEPVLTGTLQIDDKEDFVIVHQGRMCGGFRNRFTPTKKNPLCTLGIDESGEMTQQVVKKLEEKKEVKKG